MSGNGKKLIGPPGGGAHEELEKAIAEVVASWDPVVLADAGLALYLTVFVGSLPPHVRAKLDPRQALATQIEGYKALLESVATQRAKKRIIVT